MSTTITQKSSLKANGLEMPMVGLGTFRANGEEVETAIDAALEAGYRHIDTAFTYLNEEAIGKALKKWIDSGKVKRDELFIVSKLPNIAMNEKYVEEYLTKSLTNLQLSYVDLYLIHHAVGLVAGEGLWPRDEQGNIKVDMSTDHIAIWKAMEAQVDAGRVKAIGVSNFSTHQVDRLLKVSRIPPTNIQLELHLYCQRKDFQKWSKTTGVTLCAYSPLGAPGYTDLAKKEGTTEGLKEFNLFEDPVVLRIAKVHNKTPAQVLLRHLVQLGIAVIPKSKSPARIRENFEIFDFTLNNKEITELNALDKGEEGRRFPNKALWKGAESHPEYAFK